MVYDASLSLNLLNPTTAFTNNIATQTLTWNVPSIAPGNSVNYWTDFTASAALIIGTSIPVSFNVTATSGTDINLANNSASINQIVTGAWDPNNKIVVSTNNADPRYQEISSINSNQNIEYTINFQNTGTGPAVNIIVLSDLSANLDTNSFELLGTSHNAHVTRKGNHLTFIFPSIMLPDSGSNEPASHGYINYRVNSKAGLAIGTTIADGADIYFDFNTPVATNTATVQVVNPLGIANSKTNNSNFSIAPNPTKNDFVVNYTLTKAADVEFTIRSVDGKILLQTKETNQPAGKYVKHFSTAQMTEGFYFVELFDGEKLSNLKLSKIK